MKKKKKKFDVARINHKFTRRKIIEIIEQSPGTFAELLKESKVSRSTFGICLRELDEKGSITRKIEPLKERGRGKRHRVIIQLSEKELRPVAKTLRHLENLTASVKIDIELGRELLTDPVVDTIKEVEANRFKKFFSSLSPHEKDRMFQLPKAELDEVILITALACYECERNYIPYLDRWARKEHKRPIGRAMARGYVALPIVQQRGLVPQFDKLFEWMKPLLTSPIVSTFFARERGMHLYRIRWSKRRKGKKGGENT